MQQKHDSNCPQTDIMTKLRGERSLWWFATFMGTTDPEEIDELRLILCEPDLDEVTTANLHALELQAPQTNNSWARLAYLLLSSNLTPSGDGFGNGGVQ